ncbi:MAG: glycerol-3-phosphate acyltransferase, partial [Bacilli bacterium]|nr:glycerol-3-phosphate acyltransferase [Bacilli bacterium]
DMLKSVLLFWIGTVVVIATGLSSNADIWLGGILLPWCAVVFCAIGHCYSIYLKGQGGKAVSCYLGAAAFTAWLNFIICVLVFFPIFLPKKVMSISTIITGAIVTLTHWIIALLIKFVPATIGFFSIASWSFGGFPVSFFFGWVPAISCTIIYALLVIRHSSNIKRLLAGEEKGVSWSCKVDN